MPLPRYLQPDRIAALGKVAVVAQRTVEGLYAGLHKSPYHGFSVEFAEHRKYTPGDPLKFIDWRVAARTERYYIKLFEDETNLTCRILLDVSGSMGYKNTGKWTKLEYGCYLAASLGYLLVKQSDAVGLTCFRDKLAETITPGGTAAHLQKFLEKLEDVRAVGGTEVSETFHSVAERIRRRSLVVAISDLYDSGEQLVKALRHFARKRHEVWLFHLADPAEIEFTFDRTARFRDMETGEVLQVNPRHVRGGYLSAFEAFSRRVRTAAEQAGSRYVLVPTNVPYEKMLGAFLRRKKI